MKLIIFIPLILGTIVGFLTNTGAYYIKPSITPPNIVFPIVWSILYILMGISYYISNKSKSINYIFILQLIINYLWSFVFFNFKNYLLALILCIVLVILVFIMIILMYRDNKIAGLLQIPYLLWLIFATYLTYQVYLLN